MNAQFDKHRAATEGLGVSLPSTIPEPPLEYYLGSKLETLNVIGTGGMGTVLEVYHRELGVKRAVKLIDNALMQRSEQVFMRFKQEAIIASELSHPNIIKVYDLDRTPDGVPFILMEFLEGMDLETLIRRRAPMHLEEVVRLLSGPADALDAVHRKGVVHRDLKPANLFLTQHGTVKILDFGISQIASKVASKEDVRITRAGEVVGTPMYMSPEQIMGKELDGRADVYALGIIAYELLLRRPIFDYESIHQITAAVMVEMPQAPLTINPGLPPHLNRVFEKVFHKDPKHRYQSALSFLRELAGPEYVKVISSVIRSELVSAIDSSEFSAPMTASTDEPGNRRGEDSASQRAFAQPVTGSSHSNRPRVSWFKTRVGVVSLLSAVIAMLFVVSLGVWKSGVQGPAEIFVRSVTVDGVAADNAWEQHAVASLLKLHLQTDPLISVTSHPTMTSTFSRHPNRYIVTVTATQNPNWQIRLSMSDDEGEVVFSAEETALGYEKAIESVTWQLHLFLQEERPGHLADPVGLQRRLTETAFRALSSQGLLYRFKNATAQMPDTNERLFFRELDRYIECAVAMPPSACLSQHPFAKYRPTDNVAINELWKQLVLPLDAPLSESACRIFDSEQPFVTALFPLLPNRSACQLGQGTICQRMDTFWQRYECALDSSLGDNPSTALAYIFQNMEKDDAHGFYANMDVMFLQGVNSQEGKTWLQRMVGRYGAEEPILGGLFFATEMAHRDAASALIWARRSNSTFQKTALALEASGWLKEGLRKKLELLDSMLEGTELKIEKRIRETVADSMYSVLITNDALLAAKWLDEVEMLDISHRYIPEAAEIVSAIAKGDQQAFCKQTTSSIFQLASDYVCRRYDSILNRVLITPATAASKRNEAMFAADALRAQKKFDDASALYEVIEKDPLFRVNCPVASITAMKRLGDVYLALGQKTQAEEMIRKYLSTWESLDLPIADYLDATQMISTF